jgi:hypothetical protein
VQVFAGLTAPNVVAEDDSDSMQGRRRETALSVPREVLEEEALMYQRAVSRLTEMCRPSPD